MVRGEDGDACVEEDGLVGFLGDSGWRAGEVGEGVVGEWLGDGVGFGWWGGGGIDGEVLGGC